MFWAPRLETKSFWESGIDVFNMFEYDQTLRLERTVLEIALSNRSLLLA